MERISKRGDLKIYKEKFFKITGGAVVVIFFITSTVTAVPLSTAPLTSTLRPLAAAKEVAPHLEKELAEYLDKIPEASESTTKLVIFDWGKVLDNYDYGIAAKKLVERFGIDEGLANRFFEERNTNPENPLYRYEHKIIDEKGLREETNSWLKQVGAKEAELMEEEIAELYTCPWIGDIPESLALVEVLIEKGYEVRILSTTSNLFHQHRLKHSKLIRLLKNGEKDIFASHITGVAKPDMEAYMQAVRHAGIEAEQALYVDDRQDCADGAKRTGLMTSLFNTQDPARSVKDIVMDLSMARTLKQYLDSIPPAPESSIKLVIFDQGKVVIDYDYRKVAEELHRRFGIDKKIALEFCEGRHSDTKNPLYQYEHDKIKEREFVAGVKKWLKDNLGEKIKFTQRDCQEIFVEKVYIGNIPEAVALIKVLRAKGYKVRGLATLSDAHVKYISNPANRIGLVPLLEKPEHLHASCNRKYSKPHPRSYLDLVEEAEISANEAYFIDDRQDCVAGAVGAGLMARLFNPENALGSVRDIAISLSKDGSALEGLDLYPEAPLEFDDRIAFVMIKPDGKKDRNALIKEFVDAGLETVSVITPKEPIDLETWRLFYEEYRGKDEFDPMVYQFDSGEVTLVILRGEKDAYKRVRKMIGPWKVTKPGTLRHKYGVQSDAIITYVDGSGQVQKRPFCLSKLHCSDTPRAVLREIGLTHERDNLSRIFKASNMPEARSAEEYLVEFKKRFSIESGEVADMKSRFVGHLNKALSNEPSEIRINKAHIGVPTGDEKGKYLRLEVGGTYVRVGLVELFGDHKYEIYPFELEKKIPPELKKGDGARLFDFFAECIAEFLGKYEAKEGAGEGYELTFIFSFGLAKTAIDQAIIYEMTKEFRVTGVIGNNLKDLFHEALDRKGVENVRTVAVGNDTESLTAGAAYLYEYCLLSLILSTGYNIGLLTLGDIFNTEAGNWKDDIFLQNRSSFDIWLDLNSTQPIEYAAEKTLAGTYVGELVRVVLSDMISRGLLFNGQTSPIFNTPWALDTKYLDGIQRHSEGETAKIREYIQTLGIENVSDEDCRNVWKVADMVTTRAAQVVGVHLGAAIDNTDYDFTHILNILSEGTFVEKSPVMQDKIKVVLTDLFGPRASKVHMVVNRDATKIGAGVMAAMAKSSSGGSVSIQEILKPSDSPIIFSDTSVLGAEATQSDYTEFRKSLLERHGFYPFSFVEDYIVCRASKGREYVLKPDAGREALAYYFAKVVGFDDISEALLFIVPDGMYQSGLKSYGLIEYYKGITFSATSKRFPRISIDSELYKQHPELRDLTLEGIDFEAWFRVLADPAQIVKADLFRIFANNLESTWSRNLIYKKLSNDKVEIRFIDYQPAFADSGFDEKAVISHLKKYTSYYLKHCPELLTNIVNLSDNDIEYIVKWIYRQELLNVRIAVARPEQLIKNIKDSRDLIKEALADEIAKIEAADKTAGDEDISQRKNPVYALPEVVTVKNRRLRIVPLTPELMIKKADEFFILQNSVAADVVWDKKRDVIGVAKGRRDGPIQFDPELNCSFAVLDENDVPVAVAMYSSTDERKGYAYLKTFAVLPGYQGTDVASWILLHSFQEARRQGFTHASWIAREELDEVEKQHPLQRHSARAIPYYEKRVKAERDEKKGKNGRIPPKEETGDDNVPWEVRPGKWHVAYYKDLSDLYSLYADFKAKSALCTISNRLITAIDAAA